MKQKKKNLSKRLAACEREKKEMAAPLYGAAACTYSPPAIPEPFCSVYR